MTFQAADVTKPLFFSTGRITSKGHRIVLGDEDACVQHDAARCIRRATPSSCAWPFCCRQRSPSATTRTMSARAFWVHRVSPRRENIDGFRADLCKTDREGKRRAPA